MSPDDRDDTVEDDSRFDVEPGDRTRWTDDPAEETDLAPESEPGRGAPYEPQEGDDAAVPGRPDE
jgi:hypothetical protein